MFQPYGSRGERRADVVILDRTDPSSSTGNAEDYEFQILEPKNKTIIQPRKERASKCYEALTSVIFNGIGIFILLFVYILCGAAVFFSLEGGDAKALSRGDEAVSLGVQGESAHVLRQRTVEKLWKITEELNILYKENWTALANREIIKFQNELLRIGGGSLQQRKLAEENGGGSGHYESKILEESWTFSSAFLYSLSLITTVGSTQRSPKSFLGKLAAIFLVLCGFPLLLIYLNVVGSGFARGFSRMYDKIRFCCCCCFCCRTSASPANNRRRRNSNEEDLSNSEISASRNTPKYCSNCSLIEDGNQHFRRKRILPMGLALMCVISAYVLIGAFLFAWTKESWSFFDGVFFSFAILSTIGLYEGNKINHDPIFVILCAFYLLIGLALVSTAWHIAISKEGFRHFPEDR